MSEEIKDGIIKQDSEFAEEIGFTSDNFQGFLWKVDRYIYISFIISRNPGLGNLSSLFNAIQEKGFGIKVPSPFPLMEHICRMKGFKQTNEFSKKFNEYVDVWVLKK